MNGPHGRTCRVNGVFYRHPEITSPSTIIMITKFSANFFLQPDLDQAAQFCTLYLGAYLSECELIS